jgi:hypothetical protein
LRRLLSGLVSVLARLAVGALVAAAAGLVAAGTAQAASCSTAHGVTVVVDFHQLGGGVQTACDRDGGGGHASTQLTDVGHTLTYAQRQPGFVCRVDDSPSSDPCITTSPADAYWSLWWSDGKSGTWSFSAEGIGSLTVPEGGYVALSWQGGNRKAPPRLAPRAHRAPSPPPSASPTPAPSSPTSRPTTAPPPPPSSPPNIASTPSSSQDRPSATPLGHHDGGGRHQEGPRRHRHHGSPPATIHADAAHGVEPVEPTGSGQPGWVAPGLVAVLFAAAAGVYAVRRRRSGGPDA